MLCVRRPDGIRGPVSRMCRLVPKAARIIVLVLADAGLRSALTARLGLAGEDVVSASGLDDPRLARTIRQGAILIVDRASLDRQSFTLETLRSEPNWRRVLVIDHHAATPSHNGWQVQISRDDATASGLAQLIEDWRRG